LQTSPDPARARAHIGNAHDLADWCAAANHLLEPDGTLTVIWRADGLPDVLAISGHIGAAEVIPVYPGPNAAAIRVLVRITKGSRSRLSLRPSLILAGPDGRPTDPAEALLRRAAGLDEVLGVAGA
jgi:tRNA1(Val) A37 N6-methylase TrmN6